jgi:predicted nucleotidyltransferase
VTPLESELRRACEELEALDRHYALVGGLAVAVWAEPRATRDADLAVAVESDDEAEELIAQLRVSGYEVVSIVEQEASGRLATARLCRSSDAQRTVTDLLFASSGIEPEIVAAARPTEVLPRLTLPVATIGHLIALKLLARDDRRRPTDADDLKSLAEIATDMDWAEATAAVALIVERGYHRDRDLAALLTHLREHGAY